MRNVQTDLYAVFASAVPGMNGGTLSEAGWTMGSDGKLTLDAAALQKKLADDPEALTRIFALTAETSDVGVQFVAAGDKTVLDGTAYTVEITQAARQARVTSGAAMAAPLDADEVLTINGVDVNLTTGMTQAEVVKAINARSADTGVKVAATAVTGSGAGNYLSFVSTAYGEAAAVSIASNRSYLAGSSTGIGNVTATQVAASGESGAGTGGKGLDVAGTINGEAATGKGQVLTGDEESTATAGLRLRITSTQTGSLGTVKLFDGLANMAERALDRILSSDEGPLKNEQDSLDQRIGDLQKIIDEREEAAVRREDSLRLKFAAMESTLANYQSQSSYLSSQLASLR
jgi:flagellar hook-associated protein 2